MADLIEPVERVGDVIVLGERHRAWSSRELFRDIWDEYNFASVCVEAGLDGTGHKADDGGAIGGALVNATDANIPRYYVDTPMEEVVDAFGGRLTAYRYLTGLEERFPAKEGGCIDPDVMETVRTEVQDEYGQQAYQKVFEKRERLMAGRAKWVAENSDGPVLLVVGAAHFAAVTNRLRNGVEPVSVEDYRKFVGERITGGPWTVMLIAVGRSLKAIDWPSVSDVAARLGLTRS